MNCYVVKYGDGSYLTYDYSYGKGNWSDAHKLETIEQAQELVETSLEIKENFIKDQTGYIKGIGPEYFDCKIVKWTIIESDV